MSAFEKLYHYHLSTYYPAGSPCLFYPDKYGWQQLCHILPQTKTNKKLCVRAYGLSDMIDLPLVNVVPGSREANNMQYTTKVVTLPPAVMCAARSAIMDYARKRPAVLKIKIVDDFLRLMPMLADLILLQERFRRELQEALHCK